MKPFFSPNLSNTGRLVRALGALVLLLGAGFGFLVSLWLGVGLAVSGIGSSVWVFCLRQPTSRLMNPNSRMPDITSVVMTGRRMNNSGTVIP